MDFRSAAIRRLKRLSGQISLNDLSDEDLVTEFSAGANEAFELLVDRYRVKLYEFIYFQVGQRQLDAEDLTQEVFIQFFRKPENFRAESKFSSYIYAIARNVVLTHFRTQSRRIRAVDGEGLHDIADSICMEQSLSTSKLEQLYLKEFNKLALDEQQIIYLADRDNFSYAQIGDILEINIGTVRSRLSAARRKLINFLREQTSEL